MSQTFDQLIHAALTDLAAQARPPDLTQTALVGAGARSRAVIVKGALATTCALVAVSLVAMTLHRPDNTTPETAPASAGPAPTGSAPPPSGCGDAPPLASPAPSMAAPCPDQTPAPAATRASATAGVTATSAQPPTEPSRDRTPGGEPSAPAPSKSHPGKRPHPKPSKPGRR